MNGKTPLIMELRITMTYIKGSLDHIWFKINFSSFISVGIFPRPPCILFIVKARSICTNFDYSVTCFSQFTIYINIHFYPPFYVFDYSMVTYKGKYV